MIHPLSIGALGVLVIGSGIYLWINLSRQYGHSWLGASASSSNQESSFFDDAASDQRQKLASEQPVDPDPDFDIEFDDCGAISDFENRFSI